MELKRNIFVLLMLLICVQSCITPYSQKTKIQQQLLSYVKDYRQQVYPDMNDNDTLFYLIIFHQTEEQNGILINANDVEIPGIVRMPPQKLSNDSNAEYVDPFCGYTEVENNFLFFYCSDTNRDFVNKCIEGLNVKKDIDENIPLSKYHTGEWCIDSESWRFYIDDDYTLRKQ